MNDPAFGQLLLAIADDKLVLGHRNSDWTGLAPILEEDIAFSSIAQDEMAHAQALYELAATRLGRAEGGASPRPPAADRLAFGRDAAAYRCASIVEVPDDFEWAVAIVRQFFCDHFDRARLARLARSSDAEVAALARRLGAEEAVHVEHVDAWIRRLGRAGGDAAARVQSALDRLAPHAAMLFEPVEGQARLESSGAYPVRPEATFEAWRDELTAVARDAGLRLALRPPDPKAIGGRRGAHTPALRELLDEMGAVHRLEPDAAW
jgi:ring-1,2-phenylacetyl-CoA epoxidase subunit PaaC